MAIFHTIHVVCVCEIAPIGTLASYVGVVVGIGVDVGVDVDVDVFSRAENSRYEGFQLVRVSDYSEYSG